MSEPNQGDDQNAVPAEVTVEDEQAGKRLDLFLAQQLDAPSRSRLKALIKEGAVQRDARTIEDPSYKVKPGETYVVDIPPPEPATPKPENIPLDVVFEDEHLIVMIGRAHV